MATSNQEILAQLEKLAERMPVIKTAAPLPVQRRQDPIIFPTNAQYDEADMRIILAAVKRWVKIESLLRAALPVLLRDIANTSDSDLCRSRMFFEAEVRNTLGLPLDAALKEPQ